MEGRKETLELLKEHGAVLRRKNGGRFIWEVKGQAFITIDPAKTRVDPHIWRNNYSNLRKLLGLPKESHDPSHHNRKSKNPEQPKAKPTPTIIVPDGASRVVVPTLKGQLFKIVDEQRRDAVLERRVASLNIPVDTNRLTEIQESFRRKTDRVQPPPQQPPSAAPVVPEVAISAPATVVVPTRTHPTPAEREAAFDKMAGNIRPWTLAEVAFADRIYDLCGIGPFREYLTIRKTSQGDEQMKEAIQQIKNQLAGIQAKRKQNDEVIKAAADAQEDNKNLDLAEVELKKSIETLEKLTPTLAATKGFSLHKDAPPKTRGPRTTIMRAGGNFAPAYEYLQKNGPADTVTIANAIGMDMARVSAALSYDSTKGKHRVARDGETGRWHVVSPANGHAPQHKESFAAAS